MDASLLKKPVVLCSSCGLKKEYVELLGVFCCPDCENVLNSTVAVCRATNSTPAKKRAVADVGPKISSLSALAALLRGGDASGGHKKVFLLRAALPQPLPCLRRWLLRFGRWL